MDDAGARSVVLVERGTVSRIGRRARDDHRHEPGEIIVVRTVTNHLIRWASPAVVVADAPERIVYYRPARTTNKVTAGARVTTSRRDRELALRDELLRGAWQLVDHTTAGTG